MSRDKAQAREINRVLTHAIKAVHDKFENALVAEWDVRGDAAKIRNAMHPLRNRCKQCKNLLRVAVKFANARQRQNMRGVSRTRGILCSLLASAAVSRHLSFGISGTIRRGDHCDWRGQ